VLVAGQPRWVRRPYGRLEEASTIRSPTDQTRDAGARLYIRRS
jgi:hypothetical protein